MMIYRWTSVIRTLQSRKCEAMFVSSPNLNQGYVITIRASYYINDLGTGQGTKTNEFPENFQKGGGSFSIKKIMLQMLDL